MGDADALISIARNEAASRWEIFVDGELAGFAEWADRTDRVIMAHTVIDKAFGGRGLGSKLVKFALEDLEARGAQLVPTCSFVASYVAQHPQYGHLIATPAE